ncbi:MAG: efflux RND transporter permease subunit [bacterium]|nr:efflux RND transporter permease subunit [bacterium]
MTKLFLKHPVSTWMIFAAFVVMGAYALPKLKIEAMPEVDLPSLTVTTTWNGASPQAIQRSLTIPIEEAVRKVYGVESVRSVSRPGRSSVEVEFGRDVNLEFARLELNEQLGSVRLDLPLNAQQPVIFSYVPEEFQIDQFFNANIESPLPANQLREKAESWIIPRILAIEGVADASIRGGGNPLLKILLNKNTLDLYNLQPDEVTNAIMNLDQVSAAGVVREQGLEKMISLREPLDIAMLRDAVITLRGNLVFRLHQLAELKADFEDPLYIVRANNQNTVQLNVEKSSGANSVGVSRALRKALPEIAKTVPFEVGFHVNEDLGQDLEDKLWELVYRSFAILGLLFLLMALSLRQFKLTSIVIGSIFFAILISFSFFYFLRLSVNFITISGLTVSFGLLLDNSILVLDAIHRRVEALKKKGWRELSRHSKLKAMSGAIIAGTGEVNFPILATTLTTLVAFASFIFLTERLALYYVPLAIAVATALISSLFVAFGWIPVVLKQSWVGPMVKRMDNGSEELATDEAIADFVEELPDLEAKPTFFERMMMGFQRFWWIILPPVTALIIWGFVDIYPNRVIKGGFFRMPDQERLFLYLQMPAGTDLEFCSEILRKFEERLEPIPNGAEILASTYGAVATLSVEFSDSLLYTEIPTYYRALLVEQADITGGSSVYISGFSDQPYFKGTFGGSGLNSTIKITGYNSRTLNEIAEGAMHRLNRNRRVRKARITTGGRFEREQQDESIIAIDRQKLAEHNLSVFSLVMQLRLLLNVDSPMTLRLEGQQEQAQVSYSHADEIEYKDLANSLIYTPDRHSVRLGELIAVERIPTQGSIVRENQRYAVNLNWEYIGTDRMRTSTIKKALDALELPYGYFAEEGNQEFFTDEEESELNLMLCLAVAFIFMVLAALFESLTLPIIVLASVPMALFGVFTVFWLSRTSFDSSAQIGLVMLFGIVVNNAILLVSRYRHESAESLKKLQGGDPCAEAGLFPKLSKQLGSVDLVHLPKVQRVDILKRAVARGTKVRLRSILLTSLTTIVGMAPLLIQFKEEEGQDIWENLALSSIGGLASSTILLILAMPPLYYFCVRYLGWPLRRLRLAIWRKVFTRNGGTKTAESVTEV